MGDKLKAFQDKLNTDISELWANDKLFLIIFGVLILIVKFRSVLISLIVENGKQIFDAATKKDAQLAASEDQNNKEADKLVQHSKDAADSNEPVSDDWNTKK